MLGFDSVNPGEGLFLKFTGQTGDKLRESEFGIFQQGFEIQSQHDLLSLVGCVGIGKSGLGAASAGGGEVVAFAVHLGAKDPEQGRAEVGGGGTGQTDHPFRRNPVEIAPDFAAVDFGGTIGGRELAEGREAGEKHSNVGFMAIRGVVEIDDFGFCVLENLKQIGGQGVSARATNFGAGVGELENGGIIAQNSRISLLFPPGFDEFSRRKFFRGTGAGRPGAVGGDDTGEAEIFLAAAGADAGKGHDFQIIRMGTDTEMGGGGEGRCEIAPAGNEKVGVGLGKFHQ